MASPIEPPVVEAFLLADQVYFEPGSGKQTVVGVFTTITGATFPATLGRATQAFVILTNLRMPTELTLQFRSLDDDAVLATYLVNPSSVPTPLPDTFIIKTSVPITASSPLDAVSIALNVGVLPLPRAGRYVMDLITGNAVIGSARLRVDAAVRK
jgi:hypothetical protein